MPTVFSLANFGDIEDQFDSPLSALDAERFGFGERHFNSLGQILCERLAGLAQLFVQMTMQFGQRERSSGKIKMVEQIVHRRLMHLHARQAVGGRFWSGRVRRQLIAAGQSAATVNRVSVVSND